MFDKRLLALVPSARTSVIVSVILRCLALCAQVVAYLCLGDALGSFLAGECLATIRPNLFASVIPATVCFFAFYFLSRWQAAKAGSIAASMYMQELFNQAIRLGTGSYAFASDAELSQLMDEGGKLVNPYLSRYVPQFLFAVLAPLGLFFLVFSLSPICAIVLLVCVPLMPLSIMILMKRAKRFMGDYWGSFTDLGAAFLDAVRGLTTLKVYGSDEEEQRSLDSQAEQFHQRTMKLLGVQLHSVTFMDLFTYGGIALGLIVVAIQLAQGAIDSKTAFTIALLAPQFFLPMREFGSLFHTGMNATPVIDRLFELIEAPSPEEGQEHLRAEQIHLCAKGVSFSYQHNQDDLADKRILDEIDLDIRPNSFIGLTGASGSGKSTLVELLSGRLAGYEGSITVNGTQLRDLDTESVRALVTVVSQTSHVFEGSFRSNLLLAAPYANEAQLWEALRQTKLDEFVLQSGGLDALVDEGGSNLSGGQRQRLCFARALLRNTPLYFFDEATSNMDAQSEQILMAAIQKIALKKTVIVSTHRLKQLAFADEILVLDQGKISQRGTHSELVHQDGTYRNLWLKTAELERFAQEVQEQLPEDEPSALEAALAKMPGMMSGVMLAFSNIVKAERYHGGQGDIPAGHPAWIPLPQYRRGISEEVDEGTREHSSSPSASSWLQDETQDKTASDKTPGSMDKFVDATLGDMDQAEVTEIKAAMASLKENLQAVPRRSVRIETPLPPSRKTFAIIQGLIGLTKNLIPKLSRACALGVLSWLAAAGVMVFSVCAIVSTQGQFMPVSAPIWLALALACALARGPLHYKERILTHDQTFSTLAQIRSRVFAKLRQLAPAALELRNSGDLVSLLTSDIDLLEGFYSRTCAPALSALLFAVICVVFIAFVDPLLALYAALAFILIGIALPALCARLTRKQGTELRTYAVLMSSFLLDTLAGLKDLLHFGRAEEYSEELAEHAASFSGGQSSFAKLTALLEALPGLFTLVALVGFIALAPAEIPSGSFIAAFFCLSACMDAASSLTRLGFSLHQTLASADRILDILAEKPQVSDAEGATELTDFHSLQIENLSFRYPNMSETALEDISFSIEPHSFTGIEGKSGVGKSTTLKLIMRFWDAEAGRMCINGSDIREASLDSLRSLCAYMTQDTYIFEGSLRRNLAVARPEASESEMTEALRCASCEDLLQKLPNGLDSCLQSCSQKLSDGERQRIGLARAFLSNAPLMLLDEPTSNLDALNEAAILRSLSLHAQGRTVLIVSHRKAVLAIVDKLLVIENDYES